MGDNSAGETLGKLSLGIGVGFGIYFLIRNFRFGGGFGLGGGSGDARDEGTGPLPSGPPVPPPLPRDDQPLLLWVAPVDGKPRSPLPDPTSRARTDLRFLLVDLDGVTSLADLRKRVTAQLRDKTAPSLSIDDAIGRIKAGSRDDVRLMTSGGIIQGTWDDAKDALMAAGIKHWLLWEEHPADRKPGEPAKPPRWDLYDKVAAVGNPDKNGHYLVENRGTAYWNLGQQTEVPHVSGTARGQYRTSIRSDTGRGRGYYRSHAR